MANVLLFLCLILICPFINGQGYYYVTTNKTVHSQELKNGLLPKLTNDIVAWSLFSNNINKTGWANFELHTNGKFSDESQAYYAGLLEGFVTGELIGMNWRNIVGNYCSNDVNYCRKLEKFLNNNTNFVNEKIKSLGKTDPFWYQVKLVYKQIEGLQQGYYAWKKTYDNNNHLDTDPVNIMILNLNPEFAELKKIINETYQNPDDHCSAIIKLLPNGSDLFVAHNTWTSYNLMLRIVKKYVLNYQSLSNYSESLPSSPGIINSEDDYYITSNGLVVQETTNKNFNHNLFKQVQADEVVFEFVRNLVANRLAKSGKQWTEIFSRYNSGTYNNQFMIVDYKRFKPGTRAHQLTDGLLWVVEQMPGHMHSEDVTNVLRTNGYWASYNKAYFSYIANISQLTRMANKYGNYYTHDKTARALIFKRDQNKVTDLKSLYQLMRYNDFKNDPLSRCQLYNQTCQPPYTSTFAIAARSELNDPNGTYQLSDWRHDNVGAIDVKITNYNMTKSLEMLAVSGPTYEQQPVFTWSNTTLTDVRHEGHPDTFNFLPIFVKWYPSKSYNADGFTNKTFNN